MQPISLTPAPPAKKTKSGQHLPLLSACYAIRILLLEDDAPSWENAAEPAQRLLKNYWAWTPESVEGLRKALKPAERSRMAALDDHEFLKQNIWCEDLEAEVDIEAAFKSLRRQRALFRDLLTRTAERLEAQFLRTDKQGLTASAAISNLLGLSTDERRLIEYLHCRQNHDALTELQEYLTPRYRQGVAIYAQILAIPVSRLQAILEDDSRLVQCGLICVERDFMSLNEMISASDMLEYCLELEQASPDALFGHFLQPLGAGEFGSQSFAYMQKDWQLVQHCLKGALQLGQPGVNLLLYGETGTGKTEFVRGLLTELGLEGYAVGCRNRDGDAPTGKERLAALRIAQHLLTGRDNAVLVLDEAEDIFPSPRREFSLFGLGDDEESTAQASKRWMTHLLENNPLPVIWISNRIRQIDPAYLRRFQLHQQFNAPPPSARMRMVSSRFAGLPVSETLIDELAKTRDLMPADIDSAARLAELCQAAGETALDEIVRRQLLHANLAKGTPLSQFSRNRPASYNLDFLNLKQTYPMPKMIEALRHRQRGSLCLYGVPGTGKTALAEYMADQLGLPLQRHHASELLGKYVGETEKRIAAMFERAEHSDCLLFLDEADSFFRSRTNAEHRWEVTQVNEILQRMERHPGIFVCATNLFNDLDPAVLRRFTFKIEFLALRPEQRVALFVAEALGGDSALLTSALAESIRQMDGLTPGDFHVVRTQCEIFSEQFSPEGWLSRLSEELQSKAQGRRAIGFKV